MYQNPTSYDLLNITLLGKGTIWTSISLTRFETCERFPDLEKPNSNWLSLLTARESMDDVIYHVSNCMCVHFFGVRWYIPATGTQVDKVCRHRSNVVVYQQTEEGTPVKVEWWGFLGPRVLAGKSGVPVEYESLGGFKHFLEFSSLGKSSNLTSIIFQMGWFNHQLDHCGVPIF